MKNKEFTQEECDKSHPGFTITCDKCNSTLVYTDSSLGYSAESGGWGSFDLVCNDCDNRVELMEG